MTTTGIHVIDLDEDDRETAMQLKEQYINYLEFLGYLAYKYELDEHWSWDIDVDTGQVFYGIMEV